jgi:uncharacterized protein involved in exopolysaccharide biosynthesis
MDSATGDFPITARGVVLLLWRWRILFLVIVLAVIGGVAAFAWSIKPTYRVAVQLYPASNDQQSAGMASLLGQVGGLASLAGISIGGSTEEQEAIAWLRSRRLADEFIRDRNLLPVLFAAKWDAGQARWRDDLSADEVPTADDAWRYFDRNVRKVSHDQKSGVVTLEIRWTDPVVAAEWANDFVARANESLRERAVRDAESTVDLLQGVLRETSDVELKQSLYRLVAVELRRKALAKSRAEYALKVLDPAVPQDLDHFDSPKRRLMLVLSVPLAFLLAGGAVLFFGLIGPVLKWLRA